MQQRSWPEQSFNFGFFFFWCYGFVGVFPTYISLFFSEKGMTALQIGILMSLMQAMRIFGPTIWGWSADMMQKRSYVLRFTTLSATMVFIGIFFGQTFFQFALILVAINLFTSGQGSLGEALMLSEMRGDLTYYGRLRLWGSVGYIILVAISGFILDWHGIELLPWICLMVLTMIFASSLRLRESAQPASRPGGPSMRSLLLKKEVIAFFSSTCLMVAAHTALYVFFSLYLAHYGYSKRMIGMMWAIGTLAEVVFFFYQSPIFHRIGLRRLMLASLLVAVFRFMMIGFGAESLLILLIAQVLHGMTFGAHHSASVATIQRWFAGPMQARGQALYTSISYGLGGTLGGLWFSDVWGRFGPEMIYLAAVLLAMAAFVAALLSFRWQEKS